MRRVIASIILLWSLICALQAQEALRMAGDRPGGNGGGVPTLNQQGLVGTEQSGRDSTVVDRGVPRSVNMFRVDPLLATVTPIETDTAIYNFQNLHFTDGLNGEYNYLGNMGSPRLSRIFFNRPTDNGQFIFTNALDFFLVSPEEYNFVNTKSPWTNLSYYRAGNKINGEERVKAKFGVNAGKRTGIGFDFDYLYGRGLYDHQSTAFADGTFYGYHHGDRYEMNALFSYNKLRMAENGGITDDRYITNPEAMAEGKKTYRPADMPTNLQDTWNENILYTAFLAHDYKLGYYKARTDSLPDTVIVHHDFIPVSKVFHTMEANSNSRRFIDYANTKNYYANNYLPYDSIDGTQYLRIRNTVGLTLIEGINKWIPFGASAYISHEYRQFTLPDSIGGIGRDHIHTYRENNISVGGYLRRSLGEAFHFNANAETVLAGTDLGAFNINGNADLNFRLWNDTVRLRAEGYMKNSNPSFYYRHYHAQHYWWDNNLRKEFRTRIGGSLAIDRWGTRLYAGIENIKNYTYLAGTPYMTEDYASSPVSLSNITARQYTGNIQVLSSTLYQNLKWGILHWDNELTVQYSSNENVLPLPLLNVYSNLYLKFTYAKVLKIQIGADARYFSRYYAPDYAPALQQFFVQEGEHRVQIGGYPFVNAYANFHLKQVRFYVMYYHVTQGLLDNTQSFLAPHYPVNPRMFKLGFSWNFWD